MRNVYKIEMSAQDLIGALANCGTLERFLQGPYRVLNLVNVEVSGHIVTLTLGENHSDNS